MDSDENLLAAALAGDEVSFSALYQRRQGQVYRFALHMSGDTAVAEDVTQEVFLALLEKSNHAKSTEPGGVSRGFDSSRGPLLSFLYGIARNQVLRRITKRNFQDLCAAEEEMATDIDPLENLTRHESIEQIRRAVLSLPTAFREIVVLCDLENASYEDAAMALGCPVGTVRSRLNRARAMLAQKLEANAVRSFS